MRRRLETGLIYFVNLALPSQDQRLKTMGVVASNPWLDAPDTSHPLPPRLCVPGIVPQYLYPYGPLTLPNLWSRLRLRPSP